MKQRISVVDHLTEQVKAVLYVFRVMEKTESLRKRFIHLGFHQNKETPEDLILGLDDVQDGRKHIAHPLDILDLGVIPTVRRQDTLQLLVKVGW